MCWLDSIVEGDAVADKLIAVMEDAVPQDVRREIILRLPEILDTPNHSKLAMPLVELMKTDDKMIGIQRQNDNINRSVANMWYVVWWRGEW